MRSTKRRTGKQTSNRDAQSSVQDETLLARYRRSPSVQLRNRIVERYRKSVEDMARGLWMRVPRSVDMQDLVHAGLWGLIQSIDNYRAERGDRFAPFMRIRVRGAMLDELRNLDYLPRLYRARSRMREEALHRLRSLLERDPSDAEIAEDLGVSESRLRQHFSIGSTFHGASPRRLDPERDESAESDMMGTLPDAEQETPFDVLNRRELIEKIEAALQPLEWKVLRMHYLEGMTGKEVARKLRLSASRICQIHGRVLSRLKARLATVAQQDD